MLERQEATFHGLLEALPDAVIGVGSDGLIVLVNARTGLLFGYRRDELVGQPIELVVREAAQEIHSSFRAEYFADPRSRPMGAAVDVAGRRKDGTEFPAEVILSMLDTDEGLLAAVTVRDVTETVEGKAERERLKAEAERERLENQLERSHRLESLGALAGGVAHDFNNLLAVIINYASFVGEEIDKAIKGEPTPDWVSVQRDVAQIERAADRATELTHQLLAFARREVVRLRVLNLNDAVNDLKGLLRRTMGEHVELVTDLLPGLWPVLADPGQIEQVLVNLVINARDAMPSGGTVTIDTENVMIDEAYAAARPGTRIGPHVRLRVSDTGMGMERDVAARAFEPFFTTKPLGEGTGLGLATVYGIITQSGGEARLYSEPGLGTTVRALIPATDQVAPTTKERVRPRLSGGGETVLVVEDEQAMREVTERILARNGYRVLAAANGPEALRLVELHEGQLDLLLTDVVMPHMLGKEVAERVVALRPEIRVVYMSGYAQPVLGGQGIIDDGITLVEKPFPASVLLARVREALEGQSQSG